MADKLETIHPQLGKFDFLEAKKKRDWAYAKGIGSKEWIEFATLMFEQFPFIFNTCLAMNDMQKELELSLLEKDVQLEFCDDKRVSTIRRYKDKLKTIRSDTINECIQQVNICSVPYKNTTPLITESLLNLKDNQDCIANT